MHRKKILEIKWRCCVELFWVFVRVRVRMRVQVECKNIIHSYHIYTNKICACMKDRKCRSYFILFYSCNQFWHFTFRHTVENNEKKNWMNELPTSPYHIKNYDFLGWLVWAHVCVCECVRTRELSVHYYDHIFVAVASVGAAAFVIVQASSIQPFIWVFCVCVPCIFYVNVCILHLCVHAQSIHSCFCGAKLPLSVDLWGFAFARSHHTDNSISQSMCLSTWTSIFLRVKRERKEKHT